ncbi:protein phosphatase 1-binding protein bifocal isoform 2-T2 [Cochliomyia hominivorax]
MKENGYLPQICSTKDFTKTKLKPATTTTTTTLNSPLKEKTEKLFGGQYTATTPTTTNITATTQHLLTKEEEITFNTLQLCKEDKEEAEQQQQQQQKLHMAASLTGSIHNLNSINNTTTCVVNNMSEHLKRDSYESSNKESELMSVEQSCKLNNSSNMSVNKQNVKQCLNKCDAERLQGAVNLINITGNNTNLNNLLSHNNLNKTIGVNCNNNSGGVVCGGNNSVNVVNKISQKLQENQFIKNEQQQQQHQQYLGNNNKKFIKYKQTTLDLKSPTKIPSKSLLTTSNSANCLSTTTANQKKMVAVQEMKKTTQTKSIIASNCQASNRNSSRAGSGGGGGGVYTENSSGGDLDNPEDLSYGPGIVSKLRCRYLSLALRESMEQQRLNKDQLMRRSTSLNNLLDNCEDEDEEEEEEEEEEELEHNLQVTEEEGEEEGGERTKTKEIIKPRQKMGILKSSGNNTNASKRFSSPNQGSNGVGVTFTETSLYHQRSRHLKRGNDSLKRARSVEALLSEKSPWFSRHNATAATGTNSSVTIEDKIHNARERLQQGLEHMPPKRITSIIDDTERPPPDLVKQTLKMFEASANRRPRNQLNNNVKGEVASKVETFKNIIKEQKPTITYPKPLSPSKKLNTPLKSTNKATDLMQTPSGRKTLLISSPLNSESPKLNNLSEHTPDIIPRNKFTAGSSTKKEISCFKTNQREFINKEKQEIMIVDSPITALSKELSKMRINNDNEINSGELKGKHILSDSDERNEQKEEEKEEKEEQKQQQHQDIASGDACQQQQQQKQQVLNSLKPESVANKINNKNNEVNANASALVSAAATAAIATTKENASELTTKSIQQLETKINNYDSLIKTSHNNVTTIAATSLTPTTPPTNTTNSTKYNNKELFAKSEEKSENNIHELDGDNDDDDDDKDDDENLTTKRITRKALDNIAKAGYTQQFKFNSTNTTSTTSSSTSSPLNSGKQIGVIKPLLQQQPASPSPPPPTIPQKSSEMDSLKHTSSPSLTSREIEKNRINDMKKSNNTSSPSTTTSSSLNANTSSPVPNAAGGFSDVDSVISATNSPLWAMRKRRQAPPAAPPENTSMVFNFSNRKEVPDYIENDGVIFRRKRELPKPNESGFVLLGDLSVETSTDMDYDDFSMCPPSPCDVEFVNANIVIDGKSSIRQKSKDTTFRVQFNDTLTSTFEYPSEASLIVDDSFSSYNEGYTQPHDADDFTQTFQNMCLESAAAAASQQHQHHVADEIIQLPPTTPAAASQTTPTKNILGNLPLDYPDLQKGIQLNTQQQQSITETIKTTTATVEELEIKTPEEIKKSRKELKLPLTQKPPLPVKRFLMKNNPVAVGTAPATHMAAPKFLYTKNLNKNLEKCEEIRRETKKISVELSQSIVKNCDLELPPKPKLELPKILNKPQYACFLKETNSNTFKSPIMRSRSNEFQKSFTINVARSSSLRNLEASKQEAAAIGVNNSASPSSAANYFPTELLKNSPHLKLQTIRKPFNDNLNNKTPNTTTATTIINNKTNTTTTATTTTTTSTTTLWANKTHTVKDFTNFSTEVVALTNTTTTNNSLKNSAYTSSPSFLSSSTSACKQLLATAKYQQTATTTKTSPPLFSTSPQTPLKSTPPTVLPRSVFNKKTTTTMTTTIPTTISLKSSSTSTTTSSTKLCSSSSSSNTSTTTSCLTSANIINTKAPPLPPLRRRIPGNTLYYV